MTEHLTITEAAAALSISDRTLRKWVLRGRLARHEDSDGRPQFRRAEVEALRVEIGRGTERRPHEIGRGSDAGDAPARERERLEIEVAWLRSRVEAAEAAAHELRAVAAHAARALDRALEPKALPPAPSNAVWWRRLLGWGVGVSGT